ncbi:hypothetical protein E2R51_16020 [Jeotgalibacillus sp. S-D1]|nr:CD3324 family protein [Jeotgalibacillus sp. S-D1]TDL30836.1 hypothetical protein E2R51_16020 [Jeotgalibacillus sp. S-D1]
MAYVKANAVLPEELVAEIQKYVQGETLYIPKAEAVRKKWGECSGTRKWIDDRNSSIRNEFTDGNTIEQLGMDYCLSIETIKKIVYSK